MPAKHPVPKTIDEYIAGFPEDVQAILQKIRLTIRKAAPEAEETIKYRIPTFIQGGNLVHFAAFKQHIGFYPPVSGPTELKHAVSAYEGPKGSLIFPLAQPIPYNLIRQIVKARVKANMEKARTRAKMR